MARKKQIRRRRQPSNKKAKILILLVLIFVLVGVGLSFLRNPPKEIPQKIQPKKTEQEPPLPLPPEERWSYIKALENRTVEDVEPITPTQHVPSHNKSKQDVWSVLGTSEKVNTAPTRNEQTRFGLQCGAFDTPQPAEERRAKLLMLGLNVRVEKSGHYYRVFVDSLGSRADAQRALKQIQGQVECFIVVM